MTGYDLNVNWNEQATHPHPQESELLDDDGRPKRTGNVWTASAHIITAVIGAGVLALAWAVAQLGWIAGPIMILLFSLATYYTSTLLAACYRNGDPFTGTRNCTYIAAIKSILGGYNVKCCGVFQYINLYGLCIGYTIAAAASLMAIQKGICLQTRNGDHDVKSCNVSNTPYMIGFGMIQILLSQTPALDQIWWLSIVASIMSFTYSSIGLALGISKVAATGVIKGSLTGISVGVDVKMIDKIWRCCQALGNIAFAYTFSNILIEIQNTVRSPPSEMKTMKKASSISISVTSFFYLMVGCFGYAALGDHAPENLIGEGFLKPYWVIHVANFAVLFHMFGAYQVYCQPMFNLLETAIAGFFPKSVFINYEIEIAVPFRKNAYKLNLFKLVFRILYVISTTFIAKLVPYFSSILGLLGALAYWPLTIYFPIEMYIKQTRIPRWTSKWVCLKILSMVFLVIAGAAAAGSMVSLVTNIRRG